MEVVNPQKHLCKLDSYLPSDLHPLTLLAEHCGWGAGKSLVFKTEMNDYRRLEDSSVS